MKKFHTLTVALGLGILCYLIWNIGPGSLWHELKVLGWGLIPLVLLEGVADIFHTRAWRHCLSGPHRSIPFFRLFRIQMAGYSVNYLTPTATLGGEVIRGTLLSADHKDIGAVTGVLIGKLSLSLSQLTFVSLGSIVTLWGVALPTGVWPAMLAGSAILAVGIFAFLMVQKRGKLGSIVRWLVAHRIGGAALEKASHHITEIDHSLQLFYKEHPWDLPISIFWHVLGYVCGIVQCWYFLFLLKGDASIVVAAGIWFLGSWFDLLTFAIPLGIGVQEGTRVLALVAVGFDSVIGLTYGVMLRLEQLFWAGFGLVNYALFVSERERGSSNAARESDDSSESLWLNGKSRVLGWLKRSVSCRS